MAHMYFVPFTLGQFGKFQNKVRGEHHKYLHGKTISLFSLTSTTKIEISIYEDRCSSGSTSSSGSSSTTSSAGGGGVASRAR